MDETQGRFIKLLQQEADLLDNINILLSEETEVLKANDIQRLNDITDNKHQLLNQLGTVDKQRQLYMEDETLMNDDQFVSQIEEVNSAIQKKLEQCHHLNTVNGGMIEIRQQFNTRILNLLHGDTSNESTYSAKGTSNERNKNTIARI